MTGAAATIVAATHGAVTTAQDISIGHVLLQMVLALGVVVGGIWGFGKIMGRKGRGSRTARRGRNPAEGLHVLSRQAIGKGKSIAVVQAGAQCFLVGIADSGLTPLGELRPSQVGDDATVPEASMTAGATRSTSAPVGAKGPAVQLAPVDLESVDLSALALGGSAPALGRTRPDRGTLAAPPGVRTWLDTLREATVRR